MSTRTSATILAATSLRCFSTYATQWQDVAALESLIGAPRERGYLVPVDVVLERTPHASRDPNVVRALVRGVRVGTLSRSTADEVSHAMEDEGLACIHVPGWFAAAR